MTGASVTMEVVDTGVGAGNTRDLVGTIAGEGSIVGTAYSPTGSIDPGTWTSPAGDISGGSIKAH